MDLIGYYARLVATLNPILTDIAPLLVEMLVKDFKFQVSYLLIVHLPLIDIVVGLQEGPNPHSI